MSELAGTFAVVAALATAPVPATQSVERNWCTPGYVVMLPDGREGTVTSTAGAICRVIADGEAYVTPIPHYIVEPVYPQKFAVRAYR
jgi:hypothetical protein